MPDRRPPDLTLANWDLGGPPSAWAYLHAGQIVFERYPCMRPDDRHLHKVSGMRGMAVSLGGRSAASLAATYSALVGYFELSGGSG
jgi:hypothetical protein